MTSRDAVRRLDWASSREDPARIRSVLAGILARREDVEDAEAPWRTDPDDDRVWTLVRGDATHMVEDDHMIGMSLRLAMPGRPEIELRMDLHPNARRGPSNTPVQIARMAIDVAEAIMALPIGECRDEPVDRAWHRVAAFLAETDEGAERPHAIDLATPWSATVAYRPDGALRLDPRHAARFDAACPRVVRIDGSSSDEHDSVVVRAEGAGVPHAPDPIALLRALSLVRAAGGIE